MFRLETFRLIRKTFKRFMSLTLIVFIGAGFMMGLLSISDIMVESVDEYYDDRSLQDVVIYSSYGFCDEDYLKLASSDVTKSVFASKEIDAYAVNQDEKQRVTRISELDRTNSQFNLVSGRLPANENECIGLYSSMNNGFELGDTLTIDFGKNDISEYLRNDKFELVGFFEAPAYMAKIIGTSNFNNEELDFVILIPNSNFIYQYYTTMYLTLEGADEYISDTAAYEKYTKEKISDLENVVYEQQSFLKDRLVKEATEQLEENEATFLEAKEAGQQQLDDAKKQLDEAGAQIAAYEVELNTLDMAVNALKAAINKDTALLESIYSGTVQVEGYISDILNYVGLNGVNYGSSMMEYMYKEYNQSLAQYNALKGQIAGAKAMYEKGLKDYTHGLIEYSKKMEEGEIQLKLARQRLDELPKSRWIILNHDKLYSTLLYKNNSKQMRSIGTYLPLMFFLVAALVCLTTMKRLIDEQRGQIGIYVALGYSKVQIIGKYITYALLASLLGGITGIIVGQYLYPAVLYNAWRMMYYLPEMKLYFPIKNIIISLGSFVLLMCSLTGYVVNSYVRDVPATLMRPLAPKKGKEIFLEKISLIWNYLSFTSKITARNIFRYKARFLMTIAGIAGCTGLLVLGFGIRDSISDVVDLQYGHIFDYTYTIHLEDNQHIDENVDTLNKERSVTSVAQYMTYTSRIYTEDNEATANTIVVDPRDAAILFNLNKTDKKTPVKLDNSGIIVSEKFAINNNLKEGDIVSIESASGYKAEVKISAVCEMYFQHYIFMSKAIYENIFEENVKDTVIAVECDDKATLTRICESMPGFVSMSDSNSVRSTFDNMVGALNLIIFVIILVAGLLALVVLVNLTQVNISERIREIATLKVLGFVDHEINTYIFKEIFLLSLIGCVIGLPLGVLEHRFVMNALNMEMIMFSNHIKTASFIYSIIITIVFTIIVLFFMRKPLRDVDMVESLKSVE